MKSESSESSQFEIDAEDLPAGWILSTIGKIADVVAGGTPTASDETNFFDDGYPWITPADLSNFNSVYIQRGRRSLSEKGLKTSAAKMLPKDTVLMSSRAPIGYVAIAANSISTNQGFKNFICHEGIDPKFVYYWIKYLHPYLEGMGSGSTFNEISGTRAKKIPFIYPPLAEQQRIVARVEALLTNVNAARDRLSRVPLIMKKFRQAVLAAACSGRLTEGWREENPDEKSGYREFDIQELLSESMINGKSVSDDINGFPVLRLSAVKKGRIDITIRKCGGWSREEASRFLINLGDFFVVRGNGSLNLVGRGGLVDDNSDPVAFPDTLIRLRFKKELIFTKWLALVWDSSLVRDQIEQLAHTTAGIHKISQKDISKITVIVPPLAEQYEIVRRVGLLFERADAFDQEVVAAGRRCERLTQAVLGKAFSGKL